MKAAPAARSDARWLDSLFRIRRLTVYRAALCSGNQKCGNTPLLHALYGFPQPFIGVFKRLGAQNLEPKQSNALTIDSGTLLPDFNTAVKQPWLASTSDASQSNFVIARLVERYLVINEVYRLPVATLSNSVLQPIPHALEKLRQAAAVHVVPRNHAPEEEKIDEPASTLGGVRRFVLNAKNDVWESYRTGRK